MIYGARIADSRLRKARFPIGPLRVPRALRGRVGLLAALLLLAPLIFAGLWLGADELAGHRLIVRSPNGQIPWQVPVAAATLVLLIETVICGAAWPLIRYSVRQGRLLSRTIQQRQRWRSRLRRHATADLGRGLTRLCGVFAHDLNNVFGAILAVAETASDIGDDAVSRTATASIVESVATGILLTDRLLSIGDDILFVNRAADVNADLMRAMPLLENAAGGRARLAERLTQRPLPVHFDHERFIRCIVELIENARHASAPDSQIILRTRIEFADAAPGSQGFVAVVEVEDSGCGMQESEVADATSAFYSTVPGAAGLGLSIVARFVESSGGTLSLVSRPRVGTCVTLRFPIVAAESDVVPRKNDRHGGVSGAMRVLVVDDNAAIRGDIARGLRQLGFTALEGEDAASARAAIDEGVDALITDVVLPDIDGFALARYARSKRPDIALVFISGFISARQPELLANDELASFMRKPVDLEKLAHVLSGSLAPRDNPPSRRAAKESTLQS